MFVVVSVVVLKYVSSHTEAVKTQVVFRFKNSLLLNYLSGFL